jgi:poly(A) polymerase
MTTLPPAEWTQRPGLARLAEALGPGQVRWVGGAVRDTLAGLAVKDVDAATPLPPEEVTRRLEAAGIRAVPTGIDHGTITAVLEDAPVEVTTLRRDVSTDGRRATVEFSGDWREDAARRDFTINALYADPHTLELFDWFGGLEDLAARRVRFIGDARQRIREDHLRILRYYRFQCRFGDELDDEAEAACAELAPALAGLSRERVGWELRHLLALPDPASTVARMHRSGVLAVVLPEAGSTQLAALAALVAEEQAQGIAPDALRRIAALLPADCTRAEEAAARLRLSKAQRERLACVAGRQAGDTSDPRALAYRLGHTCATDRLLLAGAPVEPIRDWPIPRFPLKGGDIVARGVTAGPEVARLLRTVEARWIEEHFPSPSRVGTLLDEVLRNN